MVHSDKWFSQSTFPMDKYIQFEILKLATINKQPFYDIWMCASPSRSNQRCLLHQLSSISVINVESCELRPFTSVFAVWFKMDWSYFIMFLETMQIIHVYQLIQFPKQGCVGVWPDCSAAGLPKHLSNFLTIYIISIPNLRSSTLQRTIAMTFYPLSRGPGYHIIHDICLCC